MIVVFGGNGQLGRELMRAAELRGITMHALSRAEADIADSAGVKAALAQWNPNLVVNAAAYTKVDLAEANVQEARRSNEIGPAVLAGFCAIAGIPMVHVSTDYVFDGAKQGAYLESDPICPISTYGSTKADGEDAVRRIHNRHMIVRTAWLYSEYGQNFIRTILHLAATHDELQIVADQYGSPTSAQQVAEAILHITPLLMRDPGLSGTYHFTANGVTTWHGLAGRIIATAAPITGRNPLIIPIRTADYRTAAKRPANSRLDCGLFEKTFGFGAHHWTEGVDATTRTLVASMQLAPSHVA